MLLRVLCPHSILSVHCQIRYTYIMRGQQRKMALKSIRPDRGQLPEHNARAYSMQVFALVRCDNHFTLHIKLREFGWFCFALSERANVSRGSNTCMCVCSCMLGTMAHRNLFNDYIRAECSDAGAQCALAGELLLLLLKCELCLDCANGRTKCWKLCEFEWRHT